MLSGVDREQEYRRVAVNASHNDLWTYAVALYGQPGVTDICLGLQDTFGLDVNVILFCCYGAALDGEPFDGAMWDAVLGISRRWQEGVVAPLREARRSLKEMSSDSENALTRPLHNHVSQLELDAERLELGELEQLVADNKPGLGPQFPALRGVLANLNAYADVAGVSLDAAAQQGFPIIANAAIGEEMLTL